MSRNYSIDFNKPAFALADDEMESAFLTSGERHLASGRISGSAGFSAVESPTNAPYQTTVQQIQDVERRTLASTQRSLQAIAESEQVGVETAKDLVHQREQLENTNKRLDNMNEDLKESEKNIKAIQSVFSSFKQWLTNPKNAKQLDKKAGLISTDNDGYKEPSFDHNPKLEKAVNIAPQYPDRVLNMRGVDYSSRNTGRYEGPQDDTTEDWKISTRRVNDQLDKDLEDMSFGLSRLRGLAEGLGQEIQEQNELLDQITKKADRTDTSLISTNKQINAILKK